jgi:hypothetical protein
LLFLRIVGVALLRELAAQGASGGTKAPTAALFCRIPTGLDSDLRSFAAVHQVPLGRVVEAALRGFLSTAGLRCGCVGHELVEGDR